MKEMAKWTSLETFDHIWNGLGYIASFTSFETEFLDIMIGKYLVSSLSLCYGFTMLRLQKRSQMMADSIGAFLFYFASCVFQLLMRTMDWPILFRY